jgi:hypothetical protein
VLHGVWMQRERETRDELLRRHNVCTFMAVVTLSHPTLQPADVDESLSSLTPAVQSENVWN